MESKQAGAELVKVGKEICVIVEGLETFRFESQSYQWDVGMLTSWHKKELGVDGSPVFDRLHDQLAAIWGVQQLAQGGAKAFSFGPAESAKQLIELFHLKTLRDTKEILYYSDEGVYREGGAEKAKEWLKASTEGVTTRMVEETLNNIVWSTYTERDQFDPDPYVLNLKNGLLDVRSFQVIPHSYEQLSFVQLPVSFDPQAACPGFLEFLGQVVFPEDVPMIQEFMGYCLYRDMPAHKALLLVGDGSNGKSTLIDVVKSILGMENISSRGLQELEFNRFAKASLYNKLANLHADLPDIALKSTGTFKMLTGGDPMTAEHKYMKAFDFVNTAKLVFSANKVPEAFEDTTGFFRRWLIVTFPNTFTEGKNANLNLKKELTTQEELSGVLNLAIEGLKRLMRNGWVFSNSKSVDIVREDYIRKSAPVKAFLMDCTEEASDGFVVKGDLYQAYCDYCRSRSIPTLSSSPFFDKLPQFAIYHTDRILVDITRNWCFNGLWFASADKWGRLGEDETLDGAKVAEPLDRVDGMDAKRAQDGHPVHPVHPPDHPTGPGDAVASAPKAKTPTIVCSVDGCGIKLGQSGPGAELSVYKMGKDRYCKSHYLERRTYGS